MTRAVITGLGVIAPSGVGADAHWRSTIAGDLRVRRITAFDPTRYSTTLAGQVDDFEVTDHVDPRLVVQTDRWTWMSLAATRMALDDAGYDPADHDPFATSVALAAGSGGNEFGQRELTGLYTRGPRAVGAYQSIAWFYAASTGQSSIRHATKGPASVLVSEGAGGLDSLGHARRVIRRGTPAVIAGGTEAPLTPYGLTCHTSSGRTTSAADPRDGYKPFDERAGGYAPGEGGAVLLVEDLQTALTRGSPQIYGEIAGYAATHDAFDSNTPSPEPTQLARAMRLAIADAGLEAEDIDLVVADGAGVAELDALEVAALRLVFGDRIDAVPVTAPQGFVGRLSAGGSALSAATALQAIREGLAPAVGNLDRPDPAYGLDFVRAPRELDLENVLVNARGFGGFNSSMVLRRVTASDLDHRTEEPRS
ncbi:ketosynthase chain-length factor [Rathayibacter sp. VKM Ac-2759]|uniref:beta-ketoacyl synthase N-terminal-like domain-containing protein n=1 Tax=Rathayibacter sp. VKM Ac-2759 TaxID=2609252 RepID=UPI0013175C08|nr:beta-ketoacyl synthase N-terminal-like domain-containing protein [Rathayibacter sp. VKM Ac-2759]QHC66687.1 ketosynthase chain-length factor [Rathayibacter sp. VKM Ac-2759]